MKSSQQKYENPKQAGSLGGVRPLAKANKLSTREAQRLLQSLPSYTLHKPRRLHYLTEPVMVLSINQQCVFDLMEVSQLAKWNKKTRYLLSVNDVLSKFVWIVPLRNKSQKEVTKAFSTALKQSGQIPLTIQSDDGQGFKNATFRALLKKHQIHLFSTKGDTKAAVVERFNRTFKQRLYRYLTAANSLHYLDVLPSLVKGYNSTTHRSIKMSPKDVNAKNERQVWLNLYRKRIKAKRQKPIFQVGDRVRLSKKQKVFDESYLPQWTEEVLLVSQVIPEITEWNGTPIEGSFYKQELQKVNVDDQLFRVEKVLARQRNQLKMRWKGCSRDYDSLIRNQIL